MQSINLLYSFVGWNGFITKRTENLINAINSKIAIRISLRDMQSVENPWKMCLKGFHWLYGSEYYVFRTNRIEWIAMHGERTNNKRASKQTNIRNPYKWALTSLKNSSHLIGQSRKRGYNTAVQSSDTKWNGYHADWNCCS